MEKARYFKFESFATKDGDGIRGAVFFSGCPLSCVYCHNIDCNFEGEEISTKELFDKLIRYKSYYKNGGITFSGGEPLLSAKFLLEIIPMLKKEGLNICIDTAGVEVNEDVKKVLSITDTVLLDLKFYNQEDYKKYANGNLSLVLDFLKIVTNLVKDVRIRTVIVPNINDKIEDIKCYYNVLKPYNVKKHELLPFHTLGFNKYEKYGKQNPLQNTKAMEIPTLKTLQNYLDNLYKG